MLRSFARRARTRLTYANVVSTIALACVVVGTAHAAGIGSGGIADNSIMSRDIRNGTIGSADVATGGLELSDISERARAALRGDDGAAGPQGERGATGATGPAGERGPAGPAGSNGANGANGTNGAAGPTGPQGIPGTPIDDIQDLDGIACTVDGRAGVVDVVVTTQTPHHDATFGLKCIYAPLSCDDAQPANVHVTAWTCMTATGEWAIAGCEAGWADLDQFASTGCEYQLSPPGDEVCDGVDNDGDGGVDDGMTPPSYANAQVVVCGGLDGWQITACQPGWYNKDLAVANGCESDVP